MDFIRAMKIVFMGTPDFAVPALESIALSKHVVQAVVTAPDKAQGRGRRIQYSAVKHAALKLGLPILQPANLKDDSFLQTLEGLKPDLIVVVAFRILPERVYNLPEYGSFNLHASLLPAYRGAAPIHWALLNGEDETGVTTFFLKKQVDAGNIIAQRKVKIMPQDNLGSLYEKLQSQGAELVVTTINQIARGDIATESQDSGKATPAPKVGPETQRLNFTESNIQCHNRIRAFSPQPGAYTFRNGKRLKILQSEISQLKGQPGEVIALTKDAVVVGCGHESLLLLKVQPEGKRPLQVSDYLRGYPLEVGESLG